MFDESFTTVIVTDDRMDFYKLCIHVNAHCVSTPSISFNNDDTKTMVYFMGDRNDFSKLHLRNVFISDGVKNKEQMKQYYIKEMSCEDPDIRWYSINDDNIEKNDESRLKDVYYILDTRDDNIYNSRNECPIDNMLYGFNEDPYPKIFKRWTLKTSHGDFNFIRFSKPLSEISKLTDEVISNMKKPFDAVIPYHRIEKHNFINIDRESIRNIPTIDKIQIMDDIIQQITQIDDIHIMIY